MFNTFNKHTLVTHPVGYHVDVFAKGKSSLENKICLVDRLNSKKYGRGGAQDGSYVFALLDWEVGTRKRRRVYLEVTGNVHKVTPRRWQTMLDTYGHEVDFDESM